MPPHGSHGSCCGDPNHQHEDPEKGIQYSLYTKIHLDVLECLNEATEGSGRTIFTPWNERLNLEHCVESDSDEELLFNIPFTGNVKLKGIIVIGENSDKHPAKMRLFKNRPSMTFDDVRSQPDQEFDMQKDADGHVEYATKVVTFQNVNHLTLHFPSNFGEDTTKIHYIGLRGEFSQAQRQEVVIANYEVRPNLSDHKNPLEDSVNNPIL